MSCQATGHYLHISPDALEEKTASGIILAGPKTEPFTRTGTVLSVGAHVESPELQPGCRVLYQTPVPAAELPDKSLFVDEELVLAVIS